MEEKGIIEVRIEGLVDGHQLNPKDIDIADIREMLDDIETFLFPMGIEKRKRPHISYDLEEGSVKHKFFLPFTAVLQFTALTNEINYRKSTNFLDFKRASIIEKFQKKAKEKHWIYSFLASNSRENVLKIDDSTNFYNSVPLFIETEFYLYGEVYEEGGITPNLHIITSDYGKLTVSATKEQLLEGERRLYKFQGIKATGKKNVAENKLVELKLIGFIDYNPIFNREELNRMIKKATPNLSKIENVDNWIEELRQ